MTTTAGYYPHSPLAGGAVLASAMEGRRFSHSRPQWDHFSPRCSLSKSPYPLSYNPLKRSNAHPCFYPFSPLSEYSYNLTVASSIVVEGLRGGHPIPQSVTSANLSDYTSSGSRAYIFSRFTGVTHIGISVGPILGGWLFRHPGLGLFNTGERICHLSLLRRHFFFSFINSCWRYS